MRCAVVAGSAAVIGGGSLAQRNVILGNDTDGIRVVPAAAVNQLNVIQNNDIGVGAAGGATGDSGIGVNALNGTGTEISANWIANNGALGIDLNGDGARGNDLCDGDAGPNNRQNYPTTTAIAAGQVAAMMDTVAASAYRVEFSQSATCGSDGGSPLGSMYVTRGGRVAGAPAGRGPRSDHDRDASGLWRGARHVRGAALLPRAVTLAARGGLPDALRRCARRETRHPAPRHP